MDDWRKIGLKTAKIPAVMRKKGYKPVPPGIKNAPRSWGGSGVAAGGIAPEVNLIVMRADVGIGPYIVDIDSILLVADF